MMFRVHQLIAINKVIWYRMPRTLGGVVFVMVAYSMMMYAQQAGYSTRTLAKFEINDIVFEGNTTYPSSFLINLIQSRASELSLQRRMVRYLAEQVSENPATPRHLENALSDIQRDITDELRFVDPALVAGDTMAISSYYRQNGFHRVGVQYQIRVNRTTRRNTLVFHITENERSSIDTVVHYGLDNLPEDLRITIANARARIKKGMPFQQALIEQLNGYILRFLRNNGYYEAKYAPFVVSHFPAERTDSVTTVFIPGKRYRIAEVVYQDSSVEQRPVALYVRQEFVEVRAGQWYNADAIARSINSLYSLGKFEFVAIDALPVTERDSLLTLRVATRVRRSQDFGAGLVANQLVNTQFLNAGAEVSYNNNNMFGSGQLFSPFGRILLLDITRIFEQGFQATQYEWQIGLNYTQPFWERFFDRRVGVDGQIQYSQQRLSLLSPLLLETFSARLSFPVALSPFNLFSSMLVQIGVENQRPRQYASSLEDALNSAGGDPALEQLVVQQFYPYSVLDTITNIQRKFITNQMFGITLIGDKRDHPFSPRTGHFISTAVEVNGVIGASRFMRGQFTYLSFSPIGNRSVLAWKIRAGHIQPFAADIGYIPFDRHFFSGGTNSIRAFGSRQLRASVSPEDLRRLSDARLVGEVVGNGSIIEASIELRLSLRDATPYDSFFEKQISRSGLVLFLDCGNAFNSFLSPAGQYNALNINTIVRNMAIAGGIGYRFDTAVGPFRIDFATRVYDPTVPTNQWITERPLSFLMQFGLQHAF